MIPRQMMLDLIVEINKQQAGIEKLNPKDWNFYNSIVTQSKTYGYTFTQKQLDYLQLIYRKVYANV